MTVVIAGLVVVVVLLTVLVAGLLRSHATILRQLHALGAGVDQDPGVRATTSTRPRTDGTVPSPHPTSVDGRRAADVVGVGPGGEAMAVRVLDVAQDTVLVFLSTGCSTCTGFWSEVSEDDLPPGTRLVILTRDPSEESPSAILELAPPSATVVMSSDAWDALQVPGSPFVVHVHGSSGRVVGEGTAASWRQVLDLFFRAGGDAALDTHKAGADAHRERDLDRILLEAGLAPGDPSLYGPDTPRVADTAPIGQDRQQTDRRHRRAAS